MNVEAKRHILREKKMNIKDLLHEAFQAGENHFDEQLGDMPHFDEWFAHRGRMMLVEILARPTDLRLSVLITRQQALQLLATPNLDPDVQDSLIGML